MPQHESSQEQFHTVFERITDAYVALDRDWNYTYVNARAGELLGRAPEDLVGRSVWTEFPEASELGFARGYRRAMETQQPVFLEEYYPPFGRWFENRIYPSPQGLTIYFVDITERKLIEQKLRQQQRMLDEAQRVAHQGSWEWRIGADRVQWSRELFRIYGLPPSEEGPAFAEFMAQVHPEDRGIVHAAIEQAISERRPVQFEERIRHTDGRERVLSSRGEVVLNEAGEPERMVGV